MRASRLLALGSGALAALALAGVASAQEVEGDVGSGVTSFGVGDWFGLGLRLALVVAVIWGAVAAMRWYVRRMHHGGTRGRLRTLEVLETHALGPNRTLHLVRLGDRAVLIGATQERITQLLTVDDPAELERLTDQPEDEGEEVGARSPRATRGAAGVATLTSLLGSLRTGVGVMLAQHRAMTERRRQARAAASVSAPADGATGEAARPRRFAALSKALVRPRRARSAATAEPEPDSRESLFDRTLASIDALEVVSSAPSSAGLRARAGYGVARSASRAAAAQPSREEQIAELQRAIAAARKTAS